jgi:hypothetical protein
MTHQHPYRRRDDSVASILWRRLLPAVTVIIAALALYVVIQRLEQVERRDRDTARRASYRLCARNRADRAFAHASVTRRLSGPAQARALRALEDPEGIPILDCGANLRGGGARLMAPAAQRAFVEKWIRGELTLPELGICPESTVNHQANQTIRGC